MRRHLSDQKGIAGFAIVLILLVIIIVGVAGFMVYRSNVQPQAKAVHTVSETKQALMVVTSRGGMCDGPCKHTTAFLYQDGTFEGHRKLDKSELDKLSNLINTTDFTAYQKKAKPYCQSYVDGSDLVLSFPQKYGDRTFMPCELDVPVGDTAITYIQSTLESHSLEQ